MQPVVGISLLVKYSLHYIIVRKEYVEKSWWVIPKNKVLPLYVELLETQFNNTNIVNYSLLCVKFLNTADTIQCESSLQYLTQINDDTVICISQTHGIVTETQTGNIINNYSETAILNNFIDFICQDSELNSAVIIKFIFI